MASRSLLDPPRRAFTLQAFPFSGLVGAALLALASVTTAVAAVTDAVDDSGVEIVPPTDGEPVSTGAWSGGRGR